MAGEPVRIAVESKYDSLLLQTLIKKLDPGLDPYISIAGRSLAPARSDIRSHLANHAPGTIVIYDLEEGMISDDLPQRDAHPDLVLIPAIPTVEAWLLADPDWAARELGVSRDEIMQSYQSGKRSVVMVDMKNHLKSQLDRTPREFQTRLLDDFNTGTAEALSPSFGRFAEIIRSHGPAIHAAGRLREISYRLPNAIFASLVAELEPSTGIVYRTADGDKYTAGDIRNAILAGDELGISYMESILRIARDFLAFKAEEEDEDSGDAEGDSDE